MKSISIRIVMCFLAVCATCAEADQSPVEKVAADYNQVRSEAIKAVNQKYILLADAEMKLTLKEGDLQKANAINDWGKRLADTDDKHNTDGITPDAAASDRLGLLQTSYLKERSEAAMLVDRSYVAYVEAARQQAMKDGDLDGANAADKLLATIKTELGPQTSVAGKPFGVAGTGSSAGPGAASPASTAPPASQANGTGGNAGSGFIPGVGFASEGNASTSPFAGTVWASISYIGGSHGAIATLTFRTDGTWSEDYSPHPMHGHWKATKDAGVVEVRISNDSISGNNVVHFKISDDGTKCSRVEDSVTYALKK